MTPTLTTFITFEGRLFNETLEEVDWLEIQLATERSEVVIQFPSEAQKIEIHLKEHEDNSRLREAILRQHTKQLREEFAFKEKLNLRIIETQGAENGRRIASK